MKRFYEIIMVRRYHWLALSLLIIGLLLLCFLLNCGKGTAKTITVDDDDGANFTKIQDAIDNASNGDIIRVYAGTFYENIIVNKSVSLIGNGSEVTTIDSGGKGDVVNISSDWVNVSGFSLTGCELNSGKNNAGIMIFHSHYVTINENNCSNNGDNGILLRESDYCTISNSICSDNFHDGINNMRSNFSTIHNVTCSNNAGSGIGVGYYNNILINNACNNNYVGIFLSWSNNNIIWDNTCTNNKYWGIRLLHSKINVLSNNSCLNNIEIGIYFQKSDCNTLLNSTCENNGESGIRLHDSSYSLIQNNTANLNHKEGIIFEYSNNNILSDITTSKNENGIYIQDSSNNTIENNTISENKAGIMLLSSCWDNTFHYNNIFDNSNSGINATYNGGFTINATNNWWGHESGPYHPTLNPTGKGDNITDDVIFEPWLEKEELAFGKLLGYICDTEKNPIEYALVNISCGDFQYDTFTNETGYYIITDIPIVECIWTVTASKEGYGNSQVLRSIAGNSIHNFTLTRIPVTWYVDDDGGANFIKIKDALDNATDGDTIRVWEGIYHENVVVNKSVSIIGNGSKVTIIDGGGEGDVVRIVANWVNMSGFEISNSSTGFGNSGILIKSDHNQIFSNNCSNNEVGISLQYSSDCIIMNNTNSLNNEYGIHLFSSNYCTIMNNICENNYYGIYLRDSQDCTITFNTCSSNYDRGILLWLSSVCAILDNTCENNYYGIYLRDSQNCTITFNTISENRVGIHLPTLYKNNSVHYNHIYNNTEYGIYTTNNNNNTIQATYNWWGDISGPHHLGNNSMGKGDNITDYVLFEPWLDEYGNPCYLPKPDEDDTSPDYFSLLIFFITLICLFIGLYVVVRSPDEYFSKISSISPDQETISNQTSEK